MEHKKIKLILPFPPSVNNYWRSPIFGNFARRCLVSKRGREYKKSTVKTITEQLCAAYLPMKEDLCVSVVLFPPTRAKRDIDNYFKALFDSVTQSGVWIDDSQIKKLTAEWGPITKKGKVFMKIAFADSLSNFVFPTKLNKNLQKIEQKA